MHLPPPSTFNGFDWLLVLILAVSTLAAFLRGLIKVLFSLVGLIAGIVAASWYYAALAHRVSGFLTSRVVVSWPVVQVMAFLLIAVGVMVVFTFLANLLRRTVHAVGLGFFDRLLGGAFGLVRGGLLGCAMMMAVLAFMPDSGWVRTSRLAPYFLAGAHTISFIVPENFEQRVTAGMMHLLVEAPNVWNPVCVPQRISCAPR